MTGTLLALATLFGGLSLLAFGGGNAVVAAMERAAVSGHHWMTGTEFLGLFALSRAAPGPGSLIVALVGQKAAGLPGALVATAAMYAPSCTLVAIAARVWRHYGTAPWRFRLEQALIPLAIGLTVGSGLVIAERNEHLPVLWIVTAAAGALLTVTRLNPILVLLAGGLLGWAFPGP
ncbi:MAG: chromate transporter [Gluconacetobacter diazotrophicus]|nr:chromate transporter [Gluconacetobacter diazotrophicus]